MKRRPPRRPTKFLPGSVQKIAVLAARISLGETLWHAQDARITIETTLPEDLIRRIKHSQGHPSKGRQDTPRIVHQHRSGMSYQ